MLPENVNDERANSLVFQAHIWWDKIEKNERFKTDVLRTSQGRYNMDVFLGRFEDIHRTVLQNCNNIQSLTFQYFTQHIQWSKIKNNTKVMLFLIYCQIGVFGTSRGCHVRMILGLPGDVSPQFLSKWMNLIVFASWWYAESTSIRETFKRVLGRSTKMF